MSSEDENPVDAENDFERPATGDYVALVKESTGSLPTPTPILFPVQATTHDRGTLVFGVTQNPLARPSANESGSQGTPSEQSDLSRREPASTYQSSAPDLLRPPPEKGAQHLFEISHQTDSQSSSLPYSKYPTQQCVPLTVTLPKLRNDVTPPPPSPQQHENRQAFILSPEEQSDIESEEEGHGEVLNSTSLPASVPSEMTDHRDTMVCPALSVRPLTNMELGAFSGCVICLPPPIAGSHHPLEDRQLYRSSEEVDAPNADQILLYPLEPDFLTLNMRDLKYLEGRDYIVLRVDVRGGYSVIEDVTTRKRAVLKASQSEDFLRVCTLLSKPKHKNVTRFLGAVKDEATVKVFLEYTSYGTVREQFRDNEYLQLRPDLISHILKQVLQAVSYLHQKGIRHGDITGDNVVVCSSNWLCKLTNFDQAISVKDVSKERTNKGPSYYSSPELIADPKCLYSLDIWSAMLFLVEMMTGETPWHSSIERDVLYLIGTIMISGYSEQRNPELVNEPLYRERLRTEFGNTPEYARQLAIFNELAALARKVLVRDPSQRPSADDLLNSPVMIRASTW